MLFSPWISHRIRGPSGCAPQLAGRWSSSAAERSAGVRAPSPKRNCRARSAALAKSCGASEARKSHRNVAVCGRGPNETSADFVLTFQNVSRLALRDFGGSPSQSQMLRRIKTPSSADIADRPPRKVVQALWALEDLPGTLQCPCPQTKSCMNLASVFYLTMVEWEWCPIV